MSKPENQRRSFLKTLAGGASALLLLFQKTGLGAPGNAPAGAAAGHAMKSNRVRWEWIKSAGTPGSVIEAKDHPWPKSFNGDLRPYDPHLECEHVAFSIGHLKPGQSVGHHTHEKAEEVYILMQGTAQIRIGETVVDAKAFDSFRFPPDVPRSVYNNGKEDCWWVFIGAPPGEFYKEGGLRDRARKNKVGKKL